MYYILNLIIYRIIELPIWYLKHLYNDYKTGLLALYNGYEKYHIEVEDVIIN